MIDEAEWSDIVFRNQRWFGGRSVKANQPGNDRRALVETLNEVRRRLRIALCQRYGMDENEAQKVSLERALEMVVDAPKEKKTA